VYVGQRTGKVLFFLVKNKFCLICSRYPDQPHTCYKNYAGPSSVMESEGILEGIALLRDKFGAVVSTIWKDGDMNLESKLARLVKFSQLH
jgi:hypothetical protein